MFHGTDLEGELLAQLFPPNPLEGEPKPLIFD
jgi:hypothetical protein